VTEFSAQLIQISVSHDPTEIIHAVFNVLLAYCFISLITVNLTFSHII